MEILKGWSRKLVLPLLALFSLGWLLFFIGFMLTVHNGEDYDVFYFIPEILASIGPVLVLVGFVHALTSGPISAVLGSLTSFLSVFCIMGFGSMVCGSATYVFYIYVLSLPNKVNIQMNKELWLEFVGSCVACLAWLCVLIAWNCFSYDRKHSQVETIVDEEGNLTERSSSPSRLNKRNVLFAGIARKLALVVLFLLGASWCLYVVGVVEETRKANVTLYSNGGLSVPLYFSTWASCVVGLFAILSAVSHAGAYGSASTAMGVCTAFLGMFLIANASSFGFALANQVHFGCHYLNWNCNVSNTSVPKYVIYELSGCLGMCVWWACLSALWPFYFKETDVVRISRRNTRVHQQYMTNQVQEVPYGETVPLLQEQLNTAAGHRNKSHFSVF